LAPCVFYSDITMYFSALHIAANVSNNLKMERLLKILLGITTTITVGIILYFEIGFLITHKYTAAFVDPLKAFNMIILGTISIIHIFLLSYTILKNPKVRNITVLLLSGLIICCSAITYNVLDKKDKTLYREDLGLQAYYLYLDNNSDRYILEYTWPFGKSTIFGRYKQEGTVIFLDKDLVTEFDLKLIDSQTSLDLKFMEEINKQ